MMLCSGRATICAPARPNAGRACRSDGTRLGELDPGSRMIPAYLPSGFLDESFFRRGYRDPSLAPWQPFKN
jgi:hypothetical protein